MPKKTTARKKSVDSYPHRGAKRRNNPHVGLVSSATDRLDGKTQYAHDPHIDPYLSWAGKKEGTEFDVQNVSLHIHERIDPKRIAQAFVKKQKEAAVQQMSLFEQPTNEPPLNKAIDFYKHEQDWTNRLIAGDSLLVMNSLLNKEGMAGKVQMIYFDPPYGIKYNSNFQPFTNKREVKDNNDADIPAEPEMIQAFRDTWDLGVHSYLTHLYDRLLLARDLLSESGSCFVQISDGNLHLVRSLMDEVFGADCFISLIIFQTTSGFEAGTLSRIGDYLIWYCKDKGQLKYRQLFEAQDLRPGEKGYAWLLFPDGTQRGMTAKEKTDPRLIPQEAIVYKAGNIKSQGKTNSPQEFTYKGKLYHPGLSHHWKTSVSGLEKLAAQNRIHQAANSIQFRRFIDDFPFKQKTTVWLDTGTGSFLEEKSYVVQTSQKVVERCILMTTDPGDLVLDPTCGSGTAAYAAEQWGRRWITCDTSRVAIALAKQRLMTAKYDYFELAHPDEGIRSGLKYKTVPHVTLKSIANDEPPQQEALYDQPEIERDRVRVAGPFTVEAVPSLRVKPFEGNLPKAESMGSGSARSGATSDETLWRDELKATGIRAVGGRTVTFSRIEPMKATRFLHAEGEIIEDASTKRAVISFGPAYGPLEQRQVEEAFKEARTLKEKPDFVIFAAFHFDPEAAKDIDQITWSGVQILKAQMSVDLLTSDLRKKRSSNQSYWLIGQPDVEVTKQKDGTYTVTVNGFDYYNPVSGEIESRNTKHIAMWFLDTDYDERSLFPDQVFFPQGDSQRDWTKLAKALNGDVNEEALEAFTGTVSLPFHAGEYKKVAVKIIDTRGIESFVIKKLD